MKRLPLAVLALCLLLGALAFAGSLQEWLPFTTDDLVVHFWRDGADPGRFEELEGINPYLALLDSRAARLEEAFRRVEEFLGLDYDPAAQGKVYLFVYPSLERYQEASGCLICAANVGGFIPEIRDEELAGMIGSGEVNPIAVYLTLGSSEYVALHEFVHVLDGSLIGNGPPTLLSEGLATYAGYRLDKVPDQWELGLVEQFVKLYLAGYGIDLLEDYFLRGGYWKFTYNVGTSFILFLVQRCGWDQFLEFYADLRYPHEREGLDELFQRHYRATIAELEAEWRQALAEVEVTENGRAAYEFKLDQILIRYIFLRPLLRGPSRAEELFETARTLIKGRFDEEAGAALRQYLSDPQNLLVTEEGAARALEYGEYLRSYVHSYHRDEPELVAQFEAEFARGLALHDSGRYREFAQLYFELVSTYVTWRT